MKVPLPPLTFLVNLKFFIFLSIDPYSISSTVLSVAPLIECVFLEGIEADPKKALIFSKILSALS